MIDKCPICQGEIQATREVYLSGVTLDDEGSVVDDGTDCGVDGEFNVYCENDCSHAEMIEVIEARSAGNREVLERYGIDQ